jgi:hypothetical protein
MGLDPQAGGKPQDRAGVLRNVRLVKRDAHDGVASGRFVQAKNNLAAFGARTNYF